MRRCLSQLPGRHEHTALPRVNGTQFLLRGVVLLALACAGETRTLHAQASFTSDSNAAAITDPCTDPSTPFAIKDAFRLVCSREGMSVTNRTTQKAIVIGFLGGFVKRNDVNHPEVLFANYLRSRYGPIVRATIFGNHEAKKALELIRAVTDKERNGSVGSTEKGTVKIILYGHSWGASQVLEFARELEQQEVPVALTIQIDSVRKIGQNDGTVPANVARAINFFQRKGLTPGRPLIVPANTERTKILGNFHMTYRDQRVRCDNYRWLSRLLNKPHHQIENDPRVWAQIATLIDSELSSTDGVEAAHF